MSKAADKSRTTNPTAKNPSKSHSSPSSKTKSKTPTSTRSNTKSTSGSNLSALDAAATILSNSKHPMSAKSLIEAMASEGLWTSPKGKTPAATLYVSIIREINKKGKNSRFVKVDRGQFSLAKKGGK